MVDIRIPDNLKSDHLFLLVGKNPLPNLIAARLLAKPGATIWLLHSHDPDEGPRGTKRAGEELETALLKWNPGLNIQLEGIPSSNNLGIETRIRDILRQNSLDGTVGLNYTGGTKVMAVHVYRMLEQELAKKQQRPVFSYLDPRRLALRVDGHRTTPPQIIPIIRNPALRQVVEISLDELAALHGYERISKTPDWALRENTPGLLELCAAIAEAHPSPTSFRNWRKWMQIEQFVNLPDLTKYPQLKTICDAFDTLCGGPGQATPDRVAAKLRPNASNPKLTSCDMWFRGVWLEVHGEACIQQIAKQKQIKSSDKNLYYRDWREKTDNLELDAAAMYGYQLFAISCEATPKKRNAKEHLFEVYVRARQLGGDEARAGLVCLMDDPEILEKELARAWDTQGQLKVFGRHDLKDLTGSFKRWFETANQ
ncbi:MAG: hypothetical protein ABIG63_14435 [Chloroflexota bacterium]